jgi:hypothetical protein
VSKDDDALESSLFGAKPTNPTIEPDHEAGDGAPASGPTLRIGPNVHITIDPGLEFTIDPSIKVEIDPSAEINGRTGATKLSE